MSHGKPQYRSPPPQPELGVALHLATGMSRGEVFKKLYGGRLISSISDYLSIRPAQRAVTVSGCLSSQPRVCLGDYYHSSRGSQLTLYICPDYSDFWQTIPVHYIVDIRENLFIRTINAIIPIRPLTPGLMLTHWSLNPPDLLV